MDKADPLTWLDVFTTLSPLLGALIAVAGVVASIIFTNRRERDRQENERLLAKDRQKHERLLKDAELEAARANRLRDERIVAYRKLLAATTSAHVDREGVKALSEAYAEVSLVAGTDDLDRAAAKVWTSYGNTQKMSAQAKRHPNSSGSLFSRSLTRARDAREQFLKLAREELQVEQREQESLEAPKPSEE